LTNEIATGDECIGQLRLGDENFVGLHIKDAFVDENFKTSGTLSFFLSISVSFLDVFVSVISLSYHDNVGWLTFTTATTTTAL
jgi:hypothetical protein